MTQITRLLKTGDRRKKLDQFEQFIDTARPSLLKSEEQPGKKKLHVLVTANERLKATGFKGLMPVKKFALADDQDQTESLKRRTHRVRKDKSHLKFPLFTDEQVGFKQGIKIVSDSNLIVNDADEDYETDEDILRRTIAVCKKDVLFAIKKCKDDPLSYKFTCGNYVYQRDFKKQ